MLRDLAPLRDFSGCRLSAVHAALRGVPDSARDDFVRSVTAADTGLDPALWGRGLPPPNVKPRLWQFNADAAQGFVPGLAELRPTFPGVVVSARRP